jgi:hypothetical protein
VGEHAVTVTARQQAGCQGLPAGPEVLHQSGCCQRSLAEGGLRSSGGKSKGWVGVCRRARSQKSAPTRDRTGDLQIFSLALSQHLKFA